MRVQFARSLICMIDRISAQAFCIFHRVKTSTIVILEPQVSQQDFRVNLLKKLLVMARNLATIINMVPGEYNSVACC